MNLQAGMNLNALVNGFPDNYSTSLSFPPPNTDFVYVRNHSGDSLDIKLDFFSNGNINTNGYVKNLEITGIGCIIDTCFITVTDTLIINSTITGLTFPNNQNTIRVFPNPANDHITIDYGNFSIMNGYQLKIENSIGQQVFQTNISQQSDYLSLNNWGGSGIYFVYIIDAQGNTIDIRKIVLQ